MDLAAKLGVDGEVKQVNTEPRPLLFVLSTSEVMADQELEQIQGAWVRLFNGNPPAPLAVTPPGMKLRAIVHPDAQLSLHSVNHIIPKLTEEDKKRLTDTVENYSVSLMMLPQTTFTEEDEAFEKIEGRTVEYNKEQTKHLRERQASVKALNWINDSTGGYTLAPPTFTVEMGNDSSNHRTTVSFSTGRKVVLGVGESITVAVNKEGGFDELDLRSGSGFGYPQPITQEMKDDYVLKYTTVSWLDDPSFASRNPPTAEEDTLKSITLRAKKLILKQGEFIKLEGSPLSPAMKKNLSKAEENKSFEPRTEHGIPPAWLDFTPAILAAPYPETSQPDLVTDPDERERCCILDNAGNRCHKASRYWVGKNLLDDYTYCCAEHLQLVRRKDDVVEELK